MKTKKSKLLSLILIITLLIGSFPALIVSADGENEIRNNYDEYNCYAYAIGRFEETKYYWPYDNLFPRYQPSEIYKSFSNIYDGYYDVYSLATLVENDLLALGCTNILIYQSEGDDYNVNNDEINTYTQLIESIDFDYQELICMRIVDSTEFHFMRYDAKTNAWYNKHGYAPICKYTDNEGIPSNAAYWESSDYTYTSNIVYMIYDRFQINVANSASTNQNIIIKGGESTYSGKDAFYEIVIPNSCEYTIQLSTDYAGHDFNYEIYSYNMYNGNYQMLAQGNGNSTTGAVETVNLTAYEDYNDGSENWQYQAYRYYIRLDFGRVNTSDETVSVNITHTHDYTDHYEQATSTYHKIYCQCGAYVTEEHQMVNYVCSLCGEPHEHTYGYIWKSDTSHRALCICGNRVDGPHVISTNDLSGGYATCLLCGGRASFGVSWGNSTSALPCTENGSFILPNGIIVLADEDMEAYFCGTLEFIYPDDNLVTE